MVKYSSCFDTHEELVIQPYRGGVRLVKPGPSEHGPNNSLASLNQLPIGICFVDKEQLVKGGNDTIAQMVNAVSIQDMMDTTSDDYWTADFSNRIKSHVRKVIASKSMIIVEETGEGIDGAHTLQGMSFKYPWYHRDTVIGMFNYTLPIDPSSLESFALTLTQIMTTGLLGPNPYIPSNPHPEIELTQRENEVLKLLLKGHTAKSMARILTLSYRTIEHYIKNIRLKANCASKIELIQKYSN